MLGFRFQVLASRGWVALPRDRIPAHMSRRVASERAPPTRPHRLPQREGRNVLRPPHGTPQIFPHRNLIRATTAKRGIRSGDFHAEAAERQRAQRGKLRRRRGTREPATSQNVSCRHESPAWIACQLRQGETRRSTQSISALSGSPHLCVRQNDDARDDGRQAGTTARRWWVGVGGRGTPQEGNLTQTPPPFLPGALLYKSWVDESPCGYHVMRVGTPAACRASLIWAIV